MAGSSEPRACFRVKVKGKAGVPVPGSGLWPPWSVGLGTLALLCGDLIQRVAEAEVFWGPGA